jgi:hypothetical protein
VAWKYPELRSVIESVESDLRGYRHLFEQDISHINHEIYPPSKSPDGVFYYKVYWPHYTGKHDTGGFQLTGGLGTVSIMVKFSTKNKRDFEDAEHCYRYFNHHHAYILEYNDGSTNKCDDLDFYTFRFDRDLTPPDEKKKKRVNEPRDHLQVLQSLPRFTLLETENSLKRFLKQIEDTCFKKDLSGSGAMVADPKAFFLNSS